MHVEQPRYESIWHEEFFRGAAAIGIKSNPDFNDWSRPQDGYGEFQVAQKQGERADAYRMFLKPVMSRGNLKVVSGHCGPTCEGEGEHVCVYTHVHGAAWTMEHSRA